MRKAGLALLAALGLVALNFVSALAQQRAGASTGDERPSAADGGGTIATMTCEHVAVPGRVRCEVEARVPPGRSISWGDLVLLRVPPFAAALRGRVGPHDASVREPSLWRWPFALVARAAGDGQVEGQVRVVVCTDKSCASRDVPVVGRVEVGP